MSIAIVDYGAGNLLSVSKAMEYLGYSVCITADAKEIERADAVILPGVGAFPDAMDHLRASGLDRAVIAAAEKKPLLGICLGMQMLLEEATEVRLCRGLGLIPGRVDRIETALKLPQIGWNSLTLTQTDNPLLKEVRDGDYVYFVHSYMAYASNAKDVAAVTDYGTRVTAMVARGNVFGCQFHPEKSGEVGLSILKHFGGLAK
ncbi:MAG: imidazole glycerol phosphate synthase subunit HisH [Ruminococcaceae bacterium]|nr:imidazole glycerol phosphate synthase subunit HisH [Oscillospiraceae bacterium]